MASEAKKRSLAFLADGSGDADTAPVALRVSARRGDVTFSQLTDALENAQEPGRRVAVVQALGSLGKADDLRRALSMVSQGTIRAQDAIYILRSAIEWPDSRQVLIAWLVDNLAELAERYPGFGAARMVGSVRRLCDDRSIRAAGKALSPIVRKIGASERRLQEALQAASLCVDLRKRQAAAASRYLQKKRW
jgi:aminopeptidase N